MMASSGFESGTGTPITPTRSGNSALENGSRPDLSRAPSSTISSRVRSASQHLAQASIPTGAWSGIGQSVGKAPSLVDLRRGSISSTDQASSAGSVGSARRRGSSLGSRGSRKHRDGSSGTGEKFVAMSRHNTLLERHDEENDRDEVDRSKEQRADKKVGDAVAVTPPRILSTSNAVIYSEPSQLPSEKGEAATAGVQDADSHHPPAAALPHRVQPEPNDLGVYPNGYHFPPKKTWGEATVLGLKGLWHFTLTPVGFLIVLYACNVVAWGGMLFLLLCDASPAMCRLGDGRYDCNDIDSPRRVWIEIDSQILTALFCVTAFGLAPWRFRDLWYWTAWRLGGSRRALRRLAGYKKGWFRLRGSDDLPGDFGPDSTYVDSDDFPYHDDDDSPFPFPRKNVPRPPLTGARAPPSAYWKLDFVVWCMAWNTFFQCVLCGLMWGMNRFDRPSWGTGLFVALGCVIAGVGGIMEAAEGKRVKAVEGVPADTANAMADIESGRQAGKQQQSADCQAGEDEPKKETDVEPKSG